MLTTTSFSQPAAAVLAMSAPLGLLLALQQSPPQQQMPVLETLISVCVLIQGEALFLLSLLLLLPLPLICVSMLLIHVWISVLI